MSNYSVRGFDSRAAYMIWLYIYISVAMHLGVLLEIGIRSSDRINHIAWRHTLDGFEGSGDWMKSKDWGPGVGMIWGILWPLKLIQCLIMYATLAVFRLVQAIDWFFTRWAEDIRKRKRKNNENYR